MNLLVDIKFWISDPESALPASWRRSVLAVAVFALFCVHTYPASWNDQSRMAMIQSVVENMSLAIDNSIFVNTGDKIFVDHHFYSDKTFLSALPGIIIYAPLYAVGMQLSANPSFVYYLITLLSVKLLWLLSLVAFHESLVFVGGSREGRLLHTLSFGLASLHLSWSSVYNNHSLAASLLTIAFYFYVSSKYAARPEWKLFALGLFLALAGTIDVPTIAFAAGFFLLILSDHSLRHYAWVYVLPPAVLLLVSMGVNYAIAGRFGPLQTNPAFFDYPGSPWLGSDKLSGVTVNSVTFFLSYAAQCLAGPRGFLVYNPFLCVFGYFLVRDIFTPSAFRNEKVMIFVVTAIIFIYYSLYTSNFGGASYSIRWFVPLLPLWFFAGHGFFREFNRSKIHIFIFVFVISTCISILGIVDPWTTCRLHKVPLYDNFLQIVHIF